jgi:replicative DNA helicase
MENKIEPRRKSNFQNNHYKGLNINDFGRVPPQDIELEKAVLAALMLNKSVIDEVLMIVNTDSFYDPRHTYIFKAIFELFKTSKAIDLLTVINQLKKQKELEAAGGVAYITQITSRISNTANVEYHARIVAEKYIQREIIRLSSSLLSEAFEDGADIFDLINKVESALFEITSKNIKKNADEMRDVIYQAVLEIEDARKNKEGISGIPTGFRDLDRITGGWQRSDMIVIAARPAMGKTAFVLSMARNIAVDVGKGVALFSLEMSSVQLVKRLISSETKLSSDQIMKGKLQDHEMQQLHTRIQKLIEAPIYMDDTPGLSVFDFRAKCRKLKTAKNIEIIIIDYLQLMSAGPQKGNGNREQEISLISRTIKEVAKELNVPIIALAQLSRSVEQRGGDKRPILSDLRESGSIEQDADIVSFIYRPEKYEIFQNSEGESNIGIGEIMIEKHRNGELGVVRLQFVGQFTLFKNIDDYEGPLNKFDNKTFEKSFNSDGDSTYTIQSKMNDSEESNNDNLPF